MLEKIVIHTTERMAWIDITGYVGKAVEASQIEEGLVVIYCPHTTAGITINEGADPDVIHDALYGLDRIFPREDSAYRHEEGNTAAHMKSSIIGLSQHIPITEGKLILGIWQSIYFCEFDGPRRRNFYIKIIEG